MFSKLIKILGLLFCSQSFSKPSYASAGSINKTVAIWGTPVPSSIGPSPFEISNKPQAYTLQGAWGWPKPQTFAHIVAKVLTDFQNFVTGTFCGKFVIKWLDNMRKNRKQWGYTRSYPYVPYPYPWSSCPTRPMPVCPRVKIIGKVLQKMTMAKPPKRNNDHGSFHVSWCKYCNVKLNINILLVHQIIGPAAAGSVGYVPTYSLFVTDFQQARIDVMEFITS